MKKIKILQIPAIWGPTAYHWLWAAEMITRYADKRFDIDVTLKHNKNYDKYDLIIPWYVTQIPDGLPLKKCIIIAHSRLEIGVLDKDVATDGAISEYLAKYINRDIHIVPYGIDTNFFRPLKKKTTDKFTIGFVGDPATKHLDILENALRGREEKVVLKRLDSENDPKCIFGMPNYYSQIDLLVSSSLNEGFGRPILEGASCGLPLISVNTGIAKEIIGNNKGGFIIDFSVGKYNKLSEEKQKKVRQNISHQISQHIDYFINNPQEVERIGKRNRKFIVLNWSWKKKIKNWEDMFYDCYEKIKS